MISTPVTWVLEQLSRIRVGTKQVRTRARENIPRPLFKVLVLVFVVLFFLDEFLFLSVIVGGPAAFAILATFALAVWTVRNTERGREAKQDTRSFISKRVTGRDGRGFDTRRE